MILRVDSDAKVFEGQMHDITVKRGKNGSTTNEVRVVTWGRV